MTVLYEVAEYTANLVKMDPGYQSPTGTLVLNGVDTGIKKTFSGGTFVTDHGNYDQLYSLVNIIIDDQVPTSVSNSDPNSGGQGSISYLVIEQYSDYSVPVGTVVYDASNPNPNPTPDTPTYSLKFDFTQSTTADGHAQAGKLEGILTNDKTGEVIFDKKVNASGDDALPLISGTISSVQAVPTKFALSFNINQLAGSSNQNSVLLHQGHVPSEGIIPYNGQWSGSSESCLVVSLSNFITPLDNALRTLAFNSGIAGPTSKPQLAAWINQNVNTSISSFDQVSQAKINIKADPSAGGYYFSLTRPLEKEIKVLYIVTDVKTGDSTVREAFINPGKKMSLFHSKHYFLMVTLLKIQILLLPIRKVCLRMPLNLILRFH